MDLFPIGTISDSSDTGTIDSVTYSLFEPNNGSTSQPIYNNLITLFQNQTRLTRKKAEPYLSIIYRYDNIFQREYQQIEHFVDYVEDALTSFYTIDWSRGRKPSGIALSGSDWEISLDNTRLFSTTENKKAYYAIVYNCSNSWKLGTVSAISAGSSITLDLEYGNLSLASAQNRSIVYPVYCVYFTPSALSDFESTHFVDEDINDSDDGGWMKTGSLTFVSKYSAI
jgi:hypothetical protein